MPSARALLGSLSLAATLALIAPLATGVWDPAALRVEVETPSSGASVRLGRADGALLAEQRDLGGELLWRLRGDRVSGDEDVLTHHLERPVLELFEDGAVAVSLRARRARVQLPPLGEGEEGWISLALRGEVELEAPHTRARGDDLTVWIRREADSGALELATARAIAREPLTIELSAPLLGGRWTIHAGGLEAHGEPLTATLREPIRVSSSTLTGPAWLRGTAWSGTLRRLELRAQRGPAGRPHPALAADRARAAGPAALELFGEQLAVASAGLAPGRLRADAVHLVARRRPLGARIALGGLGGAFPGWGWQLTSGELEGGVLARLDRPRVPLPGAVALGGMAGVSQLVPAPPLALRAAAERVAFDAEAERVALVGAPARLEEEHEALLLAAPELVLTREHAVLPGGQPEARLRAEARDPTGAAGEERPVLFGAAEPGSPQGARRARWRGRARALSLVAAESAGPGASRDGPDLLRTCEAIDLEAAPEEGPGLLRAARLEYAAALDPGGRPTHGDVTAERLEGRLAGLERGRRAAPWWGRAARFEGRIDVTALDAEAPAWEEVLIEAEARDFTARREGPPEDRRRRRSVQGARLRWDRAEGRAHLEGAPAEVTLGEASFAAARARYAPATGALRLEQDVVATLERAPRPRPGEPAPPVERYVARGAWAEAVIASDPEVWRRDQERRREARARGLEEWQATLFAWPEAFTALELGGDERARVTLEGPDLAAGGNRVRYEREAGRALIEAAAGAPPAHVERRGVRAEARAIHLARDPAAGPAAPLAVSLEGEVRLSASDEKGAGEVRCAWARAELLPPAVPEAAAEPRPAPAEDPQPARPRLGAFACGGDAGIELHLTAPAARPGAEPLQRITLQAGALSGAGEDEQGRLGFELRGGWDATLLRPEAGPARARAPWAKGRLSVSELEAGPRPAEPPEALVLRVLSAFEAGDGVELSADGFTARGRALDFDGKRRVYVLRGEPALVRGGGLEHRGPRLELRPEPGR